MHTPTAEGQPTAEGKPATPCVALVPRRRRELIGACFATAPTEEHDMASSVTR